MKKLCKKEPFVRVKIKIDYICKEILNDEKEVNHYSINELSEDDIEVLKDFFKNYFSSFDFILDENSNISKLKFQRFVSDGIEFMCYYKNLDSVISSIKEFMDIPGSIEHKDGNINYKFIFKQHRIGVKNSEFVIRKHDRISKKRIYARKKSFCRKRL